MLSVFAALWSVAFLIAWMTDSVAYNADRQRRPPWLGAVSFAAIVVLTVSSCGVFYTGARLVISHYRAAAPPR
jgi:hypothetical protein